MGFLSRRSRTTKVATAVATTLAVIVTSFYAGVTVAQAALSLVGGSAPVNMVVRSDTAQTSYTSTSWTPVQASIIDFDAHESAFLLARFGGQSICEGPDGGWCSVRIVATTPTLGAVEMKPADGNNFVWSWAGTRWGSTMIQRHQQEVLFPKDDGTAHLFTARVEVALKNGATKFRLQDWSFAVDVIAG